MEQDLATLKNINHYSLVEAGLNGGTNVVNLDIADGGSAGDAGRAS